jgi:hypothetical protein
VLRLFAGALVPADATPAARANAPVVYGPGTMAAARAEAWAGPDSAAQVAGTVRPGAWGRMPVTVIIPSGQPETVVDQARRLAALSARGHLVLATTSDHYIQNAEPALVIDAIREVAAASRQT